MSEAYTLKEAVVYLGCWISESLSADYSARKRLWEAWEIYKAAKDSVQSVSELRRADVLSVMNAFFRGKQEYPGGPTTPLSGEIGLRETRERSAGAGLALASQELDSRSTPPGLGSCGCVGR